MAKQAVKDIRIWSKDVGNDLLLFSVDKKSKQFTEITSKHWVEGCFFSADEFEETVEKHVFAYRLGFFDTFSSRNFCSRSLKIFSAWLCFCFFFLFLSFCFGLFFWFCFSLSLFFSFFFFLFTFSFRFFLWLRFLLFFLFRLSRFFL